MSSMSKGITAQEVKDNAEANLFPLRLPRVPLPSTGLVEKSADGEHARMQHLHFSFSAPWDESNTKAKTKQSEHTRVDPWCKRHW
jgi:hypothetical protein